MLPSFSRLALVRTGMEAGPAPGEIADVHYQYLETEDFARAVLQQIKNVEDLKDACQIAKTWCGLDKAHKAACAEAGGAWQELARVLFTQYVPKPSENVTWKQHFHSLCNMDPVDRLGRIAQRRAAVLREELKAVVMERASDDESMQDADEQIDLQVLSTLFHDGGVGDRGRPVDPDDAWTTDRDDRADVALALTQLASAMKKGDDLFVQKRTVAAILDLLGRIGSDPRKPPSMREREQVALLTSWLFSKTPNPFTVQPLQEWTDEPTPSCGELTDILYTTIEWGMHGDQKASDEEIHFRVTASLQALKYIALYGRFDQAGSSDPWSNVDGWSGHAIPRVSPAYTTCRRACEALAHYLQYGDREQKELICLLIASSLSIPLVRVASGVPPSERKLEFAKELAKTRAMDLLGTVGIGDMELSRASVAALGSIAGQLSAHAWRRSVN